MIGSSTHPIASVRWRAMSMCMLSGMGRLGRSKDCGAGMGEGDVRVGCVGIGVRWDWGGLVEMDFLGAGSRCVNDER